MAKLSLKEGETIISTFHKSLGILWYFFLAVVLSLLISIFILFFTILGEIFWIGIVLGVGIILYAEIYRRQYRYHVTNQRVIKEFTYRSGRNEDATYDLVTTVTVNQTSGAGVLGVGDVIINTADGSIVFDDVAQPASVRSLIIQAKQDYLAGVKKVSVALEPGKKEEAIFCPQCGHELKEISKFCPYCGGRLK